MSDSLSSDEDAPALAAAAAAVGLDVSVIPRSRLYDARAEPLYTAGEFGRSFLPAAAEDDGDRDAASAAGQIQSKNRRYILPTSLMAV